MSLNQSTLHAAVRGVTGTSGDFNSDMLAIFDNAGIAAGTFNDRLMLWINGKVTGSYTEINSAKTAFDAWFIANGQAL